MPRPGSSLKLNLIARSCMPIPRLRPAPSFVPFSMILSLSTNYSVNEFHYGQSREPYRDSDQHLDQCRGIDQDPDPDSEELKPADQHRNISDPKQDQYLPVCQLIEQEPAFIL